MPKLEAIIDQVMPNSAASIAGLQINDKIISENHTHIDSWRDFVNTVQNNPNKRLIYKLSVMVILYI